MKKHVVKSSLLVGILSLFLAFSPVRKGGLDDITKPYLGEYECKTATYGKKDILEDFSYIILELKENETFLLRYADKKGEHKGEEKGKHVYNKEKETITFTMDERSDWKREFPLKDGKISVALKMGNRTLTIHFKQK